MFKLISTKALEQLYPNNYNVEQLKSYGLMDVSINTNFRYCYSYYRFYLDYYINSILNLKELEDKIDDNGLNTNFLYKDLSSLDLKYVFIRNNLFLDRLTKEEITSFKDLLNKKDNKALYEIVKNTYKKVIPFSLEEGNASYEVNNNNLVANNKALVIGLLVKEKNNSLKDYLKIKETEYSSKLNIPVNIFLYDINDVLGYGVYVSSLIETEESKKDAEYVKANPKFLPIGSVIRLKNATKKIMITGYAPLDEEGKVIFDYLACMYPEGVINTNYNLLCNHEDIEKIYALGLIDEEEKTYVDSLKEDIDNMK